MHRAVSAVILKSIAAIGSFSYRDISTDDCSDPQPAARHVRAWAGSVAALVFFTSLATTFSTVAMSDAEGESDAADATEAVEEVESVEPEPVPAAVHIKA